MKKTAVKKPTKKPAAKPAKKPVKKVVVKPVKKAVAKPAKKVAVKSVKKAVAKPTKKAAVKPAKKVVAKPVKKVASKPVAAPVKKPAKKPVMKKMVVKVQKVKAPEAEFVNDAKDFAFAIAESMKSEAAKADRKAAAAPVVKLSRRPTTRKAGKETMKFPAADLAQFRKSLIALREQLAGKTATLRDVALEQTIDRVGEDEDGSDSFMRLQNLGQVDEQNKVIQKIDEALHRIEDGTYGICEVCGQLIRKPRLLNLPFVHTCMECQSEMEGGANR